jgi:hypothetical protein
MEEKKCPEFIKNRIDLKATTVTAFAYALNSMKEEDSIGQNTKLLLLTSMGTIEGEIYFPNDNNKDNVGVVLSDAFINIRNNILCDDEAEMDKPTIVNDTSIITIVNAKVTPFSNSNNVLTLATLNLFADQILGFSFGEIDLK